MDIKHAALVASSIGLAQAGLTYVWPRLGKGYLPVTDGKLFGFQIVPQQGVQMQMLAAAVGFVSGFGADIMHQYILPHLSADARTENLESAILIPAAAALFTDFIYTKLSPTVSSGVGIESLLVLGAASSIAGLYLHDNLIAKYTGDKLGY